MAPAIAMAGPGRLASLALTAVNVRPNEAATTGLLVVNSLLNGLARVLMLAASAAIFLDSQPLESIPWVYMALGVAGAAIGLAIARAEAALPYARFLSGLLVFAAIATGGFWLALTLYETTWVSFVLAVWGNLLEMVVSLVTGAVAGRALDLRQARRLYPVVGSGDTVAEIGGGLAIPFLVPLVGARGLLGVVFACLIAGLALSTYILATRRPAETPAASAEESPSAGRSAPASPLRLLRSGYLRLVLLIVALDVLFFSAVEAGFWVETRARFGDEDEMASFFGLAFGGVAIVTLLVRVLAASRVLRRWGLLAGLIATPAVALPSVLAVVALGFIAPDAALVFWLFVLTRVSYDVAYDALFTPSYQVLFEGLPVAERLRAFASVEVLARPILTGLAGLFVLGLMTVATLSAFTVASAAIAILLAWVGVSFLVRRAYVDVLRMSLGKRLIGHTSLSLGDATSLAVLENGLESRHPGAVLFALHRLEQISSWDAVPWLGRLLAHPAADVREEALRRIEHLRLDALRPAAHHRAAADPEPRVRAAAVRALAATAGEEEVDAIIGYVSAEDRLVRRGALVALVLHGGFAGMVAAGEALLRLRDSPDPGERILVAEALGEIGARPIYRPLERLLADGDGAVRRAALRAAGAVGNPALWPAAVRALGDAEARHAAAAALVAGGASSLPAMIAAFDAPDADRDLRRRIIAVIDRISDPAATAALAERLEYPDQPVRHQVVRALAARGFRAEGTRHEAAWRLIAAELGAAAWMLASIADVASRPAAWLLRETLALEVARARERVLALLGFVDPRQPVFDAVRTLASDRPEGHDYATEVLDNVLASEMKGAILALVEADPMEDARTRLARFGPMFAQPQQDPDTRLREIAARPTAWLSPWARACAVAAGGQFGAAAWRGELVVALTSPEPIVRETAVWTLAWAGMDEEARSAVRDLEHDPASHVAEMARYVLATA